MPISAAANNDCVCPRNCGSIVEAKSAGFIAAVIVNGSFVTAMDQPNDIDIIICLKPDTDLSQPLRPFQYKVCSKRMVRKLYKFDAFLVVDGSEEYSRAIEFFAKVRTTDPEQSTSKAQKGLLRITLGFKPMTK